MRMVTSINRSWAGSTPLPGLPRSPFVAVLAGIDGSGIVDAALSDTALTEAALLRFEPACSPPCDALLWRLETAGGQSLNHPGLLSTVWHRPPYALTVRLVQYQPGSAVAQILDEGTLGTRGSLHGFKASLDRLAMRFVRDAALGRGRGPAGSMPAPVAHGLPGWLDAKRETWRNRLMTEWWSVGTSTVDLDAVLTGQDLGAITWYRPRAGHRYLADPFPWPGTNRILCEEMPVSDGVGRIVCVTEMAGTLSPPAVLLDDGLHHSYPCTFAEGGVVYCVPETTERGATRLYRLEDDGGLAPVCDVAPHARLADPTLFRWSGRYWIACTDLDLGEHDNLCLLHSTELTGPWVPHARWPVKIDVRGARPAGMMFSSGGRLFRPAQDCAATYGAGIALHEVVTLSETEFSESLVGILRPDRTGPFPHGLHTLVHDGQRLWVDGKRFVFDIGMFRRKLLVRAFRGLSVIGVD